MMSLTFITLLIVLVAYIYFGAFHFGQGQILHNSWKVIGHLSILFIFLISFLSDKCVGRCCSKAA